MVCRCLFVNGFVCMAFMSEISKFQKKRVYCEMKAKDLNQGFCQISNCLEKESFMLYIDFEVGQLSRSFRLETHECSMHNRVRHPNYNLLQYYWKQEVAELCQAQPSKHKLFGSNGAILFV